MGESSACLMRSFSHPSDTSREAKEGDPLRALGESISFGRYMSEPLAWEKWSAFSHNRYLEEVEKFSKPGSVAQKKAYFEAHYKRIAAKKAAALLEQDNTMTNISPGENITNETRNNSSMDSESTKSEGHVPIVEVKGNGDPNTEVVDANRCNLNVEGSELETAMVEGAEVQHVITGSSIHVELSNQFENVENLGQIIATQEDKAPEDAANQGNSASTSKKKQAISFSNLSAYSGASKLQSPAKLTIPPVQARKGDNANSNSSKRSNRDWTDKKRSTPKLLHMSINISSCAEETSKTSSPILQKIGNSRIVRTFVKTYSTPRQTPTRASVMGVSKHPSVPTQPEHRRTKTLLDHSVSGSRTVDGKSQFLSRDHLESSRADGNKARSPIMSSSFSFRSEERAAKRKEKLEEKLRAKETEKVKLQAKSKEKAEHDFKKMRQSISFKAKPITNIPCETESLSDHRKKIPLTQPRSPKLGRKPTPNTVQDASARPPRRASVKTDGSKHVTEKNNQTPTHSINHFSKNNMHENASPNIQL